MGRVGFRSAAAKALPSRSLGRCSSAASSAGVPVSRGRGEGGALARRSASTGRSCWMGAARAPGAAYARAFAERGATVVVHDAGVALDGSGGDRVPADTLVAWIAASGGRRGSLPTTTCAARLPASTSSGARLDGSAGSTRSSTTRVCSPPSPGSRPAAELGRRRPHEPRRAVPHHTRRLARTRRAGLRPARLHDLRSRDAAQGQRLGPRRPTTPERWARSA